MNNFKITVLGAGTMGPSKDYNPAGFLVEVGDKILLLDAGHGIIRRLTDYSFNIQDIDYLFTSHFHTDHFGDAFNLIHTRWVDDVYKRIDHKGLTFIGPAETESRFKLWRQVCWVEPDEYYPVKFWEGPRKFKVGKASIEIFPVKHVKWFASVGIVIKYNDKKLVYTGDIGSDNEIEDLIKIVSGADLLITEASYETPTPNHYTVSQVNELAEKGNVKKVLVVHIRPQHLDSVKEVCRKENKFVLGKDGLQLSI